MQLHSDVLNLAHNLLNQIAILLFLLALLLGHLHPHDHLLQDVVVEVVLLRCPLPFLEHFLQLEVQSESFSVDLVQRRQEIFAQVFIVFVQRFQSEDAGNYQEDVGVRTLHHLSELLVFLRHRFDCPRKVEQVTPLLVVAEVVGSLLPTLLILHQALHQVRVIF